MDDNFEEEEVRNDKDGQGSKSNDEDNELNENTDKNEENNEDLAKENEVSDFKDENKGEEQV